MEKQTTINSFKSPVFPTWCPGCVLPNTAIQTEQGTIQVTEVKKGWKVMGSDGRYHVVTKTFAHKHRGFVYRLNVKCFGETVLTHEHPVLVVKREHKKRHNTTFPIVWQEAEQLKKGDYIVYPVPNAVEDLKTFRLPLEKKIKDTRSKKLPSSVAVDDNLLLIAGFYIAEGWVHRRSVCFAFHQKEKNFARRVTSSMKKVFGLEGTTKERSERHLIELSFHSAMLARVFEEWFGKGAPHKKVPSWLMKLSPRRQCTLIHSIWDGDGYINKRMGRASFKTCSLQLCEDMKFLLIRQGIVPTISEYKAYGIHKRSYAVQVVNARDYEIMSDIFSLPKQQKGPGRSQNGFIHEQYVLLPIRSVEKIRYDGLVYNMEVEDVNSYLTRSATLHNCGDWGIWASVKGALVEQNIAPHEVLFVYDIGCSGNMTSFVNAYGFHGLHGRAIPLAEGAAMANHKLPILVVGGDGGLYGEGMGHFIAACRANHNITVMVHNNMVYGLTTGQVSPTAAKGFKAKSTPDGVIDQPINPIALAIVSGATFVARGFAGDQKHLQELIVRGMQHNGFSLIDVFQPCVTFNKVNTYSWFRERVKKIADSRGLDADKRGQGIHDVADKKAAMEKAMSEDPLWIGVFYESDEPSYEQQLPQLEKEALVEKDISEVNISELVEEFQ